jgi:choline transport protein
MLNLILDYTCVILGIALVLGIANWFLHAKKYYEGPTIQM